MRSNNTRRANVIRVECLRSRICPMSDCIIKIHITQRTDRGEVLHACDTGEDHFLETSRANNAPSQRCSSRALASWPSCTGPTLISSFSYNVTSASRCYVRTLQWCTATPSHSRHFLARRGGRFFPRGKTSRTRVSSFLMSRSGSANAHASMREDNAWLISSTF